MESKQASDEWKEPLEALVFRRVAAILEKSNTNLEAWMANLKNHLSWLASVSTSYSRVVCNFVAS